MDDVANRLARELAEAISAAVAQSADVAACRERAREAGFDLKVSLEAVVGFASRERTGKNESKALMRVSSPLPSAPVPARSSFDVTANDRRFLRSLRIAADEATEPVD